MHNGSSIIASQWMVHVIFKVKIKKTSLVSSSLMWIFYVFFTSDSIHSIYFRSGTWQTKQHTNLEVNTMQIRLTSYVYRHWGGYVFIFVCLLAGLCNNDWTVYHETWRKDVVWVREETRSIFKWIQEFSFTFFNIFNIFIVFPGNYSLNFIKINTSATLDCYYWFFSWLIVQLFGP